MTSSIGQVIWFCLFALTAIVPPWGALGLLFGYALADRSFSFFYVPVFSIPIFISEMVLAVMGIHLLIRQRSKAFEGWTWKSPWTFFITLGVVNIFRGLAAFDFVLVLRDAAIVYYSVITWLALRYAHGKKAIYAIFWVLLTGLLVQQILRWKPLWRDGEFIGTPSIGMYASILIVGALCAYSLWSRWRWPLYAFFGFLMMIIASSQIRTVWVALLLAAIFAGWVAWRCGTNRRFALHFSALMGASLVVLCIYYKLYHPQDLQSLHREVSSFYQGRDSPNVMTRIAMWEDALESMFPPLAPVFRAFDRRVLDPWLGLTGANANLREEPRNPTNYVPQKSGTAIIESVRSHGKVEFPEPPKPAITLPVAVSSDHSMKAPASLSRHFSKLTKLLDAAIGTPFGEKFVPTRVSYVHKADRYDPHNSVIALGYRMGCVGLLLFVIILWQEMKKAYRVAQQTEDNERKALILACMSGVIYHLGHSLTDVTLENSFKGGILWLLIGLLMALRKEEDQSRTI